MKKVAVIGYGGQGAWHCAQVLKSDVCTLAGTYDIKEARREAARANGIFVYENNEAIFADKSVDVIVVATPNDVHEALVVNGLTSGHHVVCEKPVALSVAEFDRMCAAAEASGKIFTVHQNRRWDVDFRAVKQVIGSGEIGEVIRIESRIHGSRGIPSDWRCHKAPGGGMVLDWGVHLLDQALLLFPEAKVETVYATLTNVTNTLVDDGFTVDLGMSNGVHIIVEVGTNNFIRLPRWMVLGTNGTAQIADWKKNGKIVCATGINEQDIVPVITAAGLTKTMAPRREDTIKTYPLPEIHSDVRDFYRNVIAHLNGEADRLIKLPQVMRVMKVMEAIWKSAQTREVIHFEK